MDKSVGLFATELRKTKTAYLSFSALLNAGQRVKGKGQRVKGKGSKGKGQRV